MTDPIVESVVAKLRSRAEVGQAKYGVTLERGDLSLFDWLVHAQEEAMDFANYLECAIGRVRGLEEEVGRLRAEQGVIRSELTVAARAAAWAVLYEAREGAE